MIGWTFDGNVMSLTLTPAFSMSLLIRWLMVLASSPGNTGIWTWIHINCHWPLIHFQISTSTWMLPGPCAWP